MILGLLLLTSSLSTSPLADALKAEEGLWIRDEIGPSPCLHGIRIEAETGLLLRVTLCENGRTEFEKQQVNQVTLDQASSWGNALGLSVDTVSLGSSCPSSTIPSSFHYAFDRSISTASGAQLIFMSATGEASTEDYRSGASFPDLGKSKNCALIIKRAQQTFQKDNQLLQKAAKACALSWEEAGCVDREEAP